MPSIIVPSDFSKNSTVALRYAIQLCKISKLDLIVFHASHISAYALSAASTEEQMTLLLQISLLQIQIFLFHYSINMQ